MRMVLALVLVLFSASAAHAQCSPFPTSYFLSNFSHDDIRTYVDEKHGGDWEPYLGMLEANLDRLQKMNMDGRGATLRVKGQPTKLTAATLSRFVYTSRQWLAVAQCLADNGTADDLNNFATAVGGDETDVAPTTQVAPKQEQETSYETAMLNSRLNETSRPSTGEVQVASNTVSMDADAASGSSNAVQVRIDTKCRDGYTMFNVVNLGKTWPNTGTFSLYRLDGKGGQVIGGRRISMREGEEKTFTVSPSQNRTGHVGLAIEPSWYSREMKIDADARCG